MKNLNYILQKFKELQVDYQVDSNYKNVKRELLDISENYQEGTEVLNNLNQPLGFDDGQIKIYYPISHGELEPIYEIYKVDPETRPRDLLDTFSKFYSRPLAQGNIDYYLSLGEQYNYLLEPILYIKHSGGPKVRDLVNEYITEIVPYQDGYLLVIE
jgi:hypothetical protein